MMKKGAANRDGLTSDNYLRSFSSAMTFPQLVSESSVMALLFAVFSMQSGQANSSLSGVRPSAAGETIVPITRPDADQPPYRPCDHLV
jgi:hypothetical protein